MKNIAWFEDIFRSDIPGIGQVQERDLHDRNAHTLCLNNPGYRSVRARRQRASSARPLCWHR